MTLADEVCTMVHAFNAGDSRRDYVRNMAVRVAALESQLIESQQQVEVLTTSSEQAAEVITDLNVRHHAAIARAERSGGDEAIARAECERLRAGLVELREAWAAQAIAAKVTAERARVVEAIAASHDNQAQGYRAVADAACQEYGERSAFALIPEAKSQAYEHAAEHIRTANWAPPEEDGNE